MTIERRPLNTGDILHLVEIGVIIFGMGMGWQQLRTNLETTARQDAILKDHGSVLHRLELYQASKDPDYWKFAESQK